VALNAAMKPGFTTADPAAALARFLTSALGARSAGVTRLAKLGGGAIQENWAVDATVQGGPRSGTHALVLRTDSPSGVAVSHDRAREFAILQAAHGAGVAVPEPIALCRDAKVLGKPFSLMRRIAGTAAGHVITRDDKWHGDRAALAARLGRELAKLHRIVPPRDDLGFLEQPQPTPALASIAAYRAWLDTYRDPRPALEWALAWLAEHAPSTAQVALCHRDFRTGNYMVDDAGLTGILDWEFAGWSDPDEDIGWFCAKCWRFGQTAREAGGVAPRAAFLAGYEAESGRNVDRGRMHYWEVMAHARWAVIALQQGERHVSGAEPSLDLALTGRRIAELEWELLRMTRLEAAQSRVG
jgi:aminoglycoside phosphotransferase (APT) family kinase protein